MTHLRSEIPHERINAKPPKCVQLDRSCEVPSTSIGCVTPDDSLYRSGPQRALNRRIGDLRPDGSLDHGAFMGSNVPEADAGRGADSGGLGFLVKEPLCQSDDSIDSMDDILYVSRYKSEIRLGYWPRFPKWRRLQVSFMRDLVSSFRD